MPSAAPKEYASQKAELVTRLNARQRAFCEHFALNFNGTKSALLAGYSSRTARQIACENLTKPDIKKYVRYLRDQLAADVEQTEADLTASWSLIATADPSELVEHRRGACRYCHGTDHAYQWRTDREYKSALKLWQSLSDANQQITARPEDDGGVGYRRTLLPNPDCPECDGHGNSYQFIHDTRTLSTHAKALYRGVQSTKDGLKILMADKDKALEQLGKIKGLYEKSDAAESANSLGSWIKDLQRRGSKPPIRSGN